MNKRILSNACVMICLFVAASCTKNPEKPVPEPEPPVSGSSKISRIEYEGNHVLAVYDAEGRIKTLTSKDLNGVPQQTYNFLYQNGKLSEVQYGGKWKYTYMGDLIMKVETFNEAGALKWQTDFVYTNNRITEKTEYRITNLGTSPYTRTLFEYNTAGNISKKTFFQWTNQTWHKSEEVQIPEYDNHPNTTDHFENYPYMPAGLYSVNNPLKELYVDVSGPVSGTVTHQYTYDAQGRPSTRKTTYAYPGFPEEIETTKLFY
jgi:hypothetical protein